MVELPNELTKEPTRIAPRPRTAHRLARQSQSGSLRTAKEPKERRRETYSLLQTSNLLPGLHVFASRLQELLVGQVKGLADGERDLLGLQRRTVIFN